MSSELSKSSSNLDLDSASMSASAVEEVQSPLQSPMQSPIKSPPELPRKNAKKQAIQEESIKPEPLVAPTIKSIKEKIVSKLNYKVQHRKNFSKLGLKDIAQWKNPVASAAIYIAGQMLFFMLLRWKITFALVLGRLLVMQILICFAYFIGMKIVAPNREVSVPSQLDITPENVREYLEQLSGKVYSILAWYVSVLLCKDFRVTIAFALAVEAFNRVIARRLTAMSFSYIVFNAFFILPTVYELFEDELHYFFNFGKEKACLAVDFVQTKVNQLVSKAEVKEFAESKKQK